jgi:nucleoside-diphosphate-sugar epimerase
MEGSLGVNVLVTGANGYIGRAVVNRLMSEQKHIPVAAVRSMKIADKSQCLYVETGDLSADNDWSEILKDIDVIIHTAGIAHTKDCYNKKYLKRILEVNTEATLSLARQAVKAGVRRFIFISSMGVYGNPNNMAIKNCDIPNPVEPYAISKFKAENGLRDISKSSRLELTILRPPMVYGPSSPGNLSKLVKLIERKIPLPLASVKNRRSFIFIGNLTDIIVKCVDSPNVIGKTYIVCDNEAISTPELIRKLSSELGVAPMLFAFPPGILKLISQIFGVQRQISSLIDSFEIDCKTIGKDLEWTPPFTISQGLHITIQDSN